MYYGASPGAWDFQKVVLVKDTASPVIKYYESTGKICTWTDADGDTQTLEIAVLSAQVGDTKDATEFTTTADMTTHIADQVVAAYTGDSRRLAAEDF